MNVLEGQLLGGVLVLAASAVALGSLTGWPSPKVGAGRGALLLVAALGTSGCVVVGMSQATQPIDPLSAVVQSALWIMVLGAVGAGLFGWDGLLRPLARVVPGGALIDATTTQLAVAAVAALFVVKYLINLGFALWAP